MATDLTRDDLRRLARMGALRRLEELRQEEAAIRAAFPDLGGTSGTGRRRGRPSRNAQPASSDDSGQRRRGGRRRGYKMSAAQKKAVSERMRKYWADRRKGRG